MRVADRRLALALVVSGLFVFVGVRPSTGSCAGPSLELLPRQVRLGQNLTIKGAQFSNAPCEDTGGGCLPRKKRRVEPLRGIEVSIQQAGRIERVATVDADNHYRIEITVPVPTSFQPGRAQVVAQSVAQIEILP